MVLLGFNYCDDRTIALEFLRENSVTFPNALDTSDAAKATASRHYRSSGVPLNYIIDQEGKVAASWYGYGHTRAPDVLKTLGAK